jgi:hypothetical protein
MMFCTGLIRWPTMAPPNQDIDGDCLSNYQEMMLGTDPLEWDTDGDGLADGWEVENSVNGQSESVEVWTVTAMAPADGQENPDGDWMAIDKTPPDTNVVQRPSTMPLASIRARHGAQKFS